MAKTWKELAQELGFTVQAFSRWRKLPGAPTGPENHDEWRKFIEENDLGASGNRVGKTREHWLVEKLKREVRMQELRYKKEEGKLVAIEDVASFVAQLGFSCRQWAYSAMRELPRLTIGMELAEAQAFAEDYGDKLVDDLAGQVENWWKQTAPGEPIPEINEKDEQ